MATEASPDKYKQVREDIAKDFPNENYDDGSFAPVVQVYIYHFYIIFLILVRSLRLAWHASGTYDKNHKDGGSDGATMRYKAEAEDPANAGLEHARTFLEPIKAKHPWITYADLWT